MSCSQPTASRQFSKPCRTSISSRVRVKVRLSARMWEAELMRGESGGIGFHLLRPFAAGGFVEHVAWSGVIVDADPLPESAAEQRGRRDAEDLARQVPERHFDAAGRAHQFVRRAVGAGAAEVGRVLAEKREDRVDLQRIFAGECRLEREDLFFDADGGSAIGFGDAVGAIVSDHFDEDIGSRRTFERHRPDIANLAASRRRVCQERKGS